MAKKKKKQKKTSPPKQKPARQEPPQQASIATLEERIAQLGGQVMFTAEGEALDPELRERFLKNVLAVEEAGWAKPARQLEEGGFELVPATDLDDESLSKKLWELIHAMALCNNYVINTNHLSDRELYTALVEDVLQQESLMGPVGPASGGHWTIDMVGSGSEEDTQTYLKYYADEAWRAHWAKDWPEDVIPPHEDPPYDRDRHLPQPEWPPGDFEEEEPVM